MTGRVPRGWVSFLAACSVAVALIIPALVDAPTSAAAAAPSASTASGPRPPGGSFRAVAPARVLDTRAGLGAAKGPTRESIVHVLGTAGVPSSGVSAVVVNLTVTGSIAPGWAIAYDGDQARPGTSQVNYAKSQTVAAMTVPGVSSAGTVTVYSSAPAQLILDVSGYFTTPDAGDGGALFHTITPRRFADTRQTHQTLHAASVLTVQVTGQAGIPAGALAAVVNTTAVSPTATGYLTDYPADQARPVTSTLNFTPRQIVANRAIVPLSTAGAFNIYNPTGSVDVVVDITGFLTVGTIGSYYVPLWPQRLIDTRPSGLPAYGLAEDIAGAGCRDTAANCVPSPASVTTPTAALITMTVVPGGVDGVGSVGTGPLTNYVGKSPYGTSDLNYRGSAPVANAALPGLDSTGVISLYQSTSQANVLVDLYGYFANAAPSPTQAGIWWTEDSNATAIPQSGAHIPNVVALAASDGPFGWALDGSGTVWRFSEPFGDSSKPEPLPGLPGGFTQLAAGNEFYADFTYGLRADGTVWKWGYGANGFAVSQVPGLSGVTSIGAAWGIGYAIKSDGTVWATGDNTRDQLGNSSAAKAWVSTPVQVQGLPAITSVGGVTGRSWALDGAGNIWEWGDSATATTGKPGSVPAVVGSVCAGGSIKGQSDDIVCPDGTLLTFSQTGFVLVNGLPPVKDAAPYTVLTTDGRVFYRTGASWTASPGLTGINAIAEDIQWRFAAAG